MLNAGWQFLCDMMRIQLTQVFYCASDRYFLNCRNAHLQICKKDIKRNLCASWWNLRNFECAFMPGYGKRKFYQFQKAIEAKLRQRPCAFSHNAGSVQLASNKLPDSFANSDLSWNSCCTSWSKLSKIWTILLCATQVNS